MLFVLEEFLRELRARNLLNLRNLRRNLELKV
jgi:hypothetical protein